MDKAYLSKERYAEIQKELEALKTDGRREIAERLKTAKDLGDLSENADYQEARDEQVRMEQHIAQMEELLRNSSIIHKSGNATVVRVGTKVRVKKEKNVVEYTLVGSNEADPAKGLISNESPAGRALLGKKVGDVAVAQTPKGELKLQILSIE